MGDIYIIAEIGQAHDGSLGILHSYIESLKGSGVDAIKFQTHIAHAESSMHEPFRVNFSYEDKTRYDYWKRMGFSKEQWIGIKEHCERIGIEFLSSPFSIEAVDLLEEIGIKRYKIGSGEVTNYLLLDKVSKTKKPIILSSGMSSYEEINHAIDRVSVHNKNISLLHCTTSYPTNSKNLGFNVIEEFKSRFSVPIGFSDHSGRLSTAIAAAAMGIEILEFHVVFDKKMFGPDAQSSIEIRDVPALVDQVRFIGEAIRSPVDKDDLSAYLDTKKMFEKSLAVKKTISRGEAISLVHLESKKPSGYGVSAREYEDVLGRKVNKSLNVGDFLTYEDIEK